MKGLIENIQNFCVHDGKGIRTVVFFKGCPLRCHWCSNPTTQEFTQELLYYVDKCFACKSCISVCPQGALSFEDKLFIDKAKCTLCGACTRACSTKSLRLSGKERTVSEIIEEIQKDFIFYTHSGGGVTLSGGEVLAQAEFAEKLLQACKRYGIHLAIETSGFGKKESLLTLAQYLDEIFFDVKHIDNEEHLKITGKENTRILSNLEVLLEKYADKITVRLPLIPEYNDQDAHLIRYAQKMNELDKIQRIEVLPYHQLGKNKYQLLNREYALEGTPVMEKALFEEKLQILQKNLLYAELLS